MKIGELSKRTGLAASKIRFYEDRGLLTQVNRKSNGYRSYPPEAELVLNLIITGQNAGFSLDELQKLLPSDLERWDHHSLVVALREKLNDIEALERKLADNKAQLTKILSEIEFKPTDIDCADNAKRVLGQIGLTDPKASHEKGD
ncbi:MerR family transcriptional regulator [Vibrio sp. V38_P2S17PM301]|uniref:MerR family transcriptional regulator n=1 Tax=Vibrio sp. V38_P2S17PM301 TaxID=1938689 RepID=UPI001360C7FC|nr:MerR family transcriptional regulator [Vibrio sp. V38_P2S17PM301]NAX25439.1 MerR family transcriptional regulator [Vibrio sp. V38_P2S17PM301]